VERTALPSVTQAPEREGARLEWVVPVRRRRKACWPARFAVPSDVL